MNNPITKMKEIWTKWSHEGVRWPYLYDPVSKSPSVTLSFAYIAFVIAAGSVIALHAKPEMLTATCMSMIFWVMATVLYMIRKLNKAKFDLQNKSLELDADTTNDPKP